MLGWNCCIESVFVLVGWVAVSLRGGGGWLYRECIQKGSALHAAEQLTKFNKYTTANYLFFTININNYFVTT
jgi:hypothetical protein